METYNIILLVIIAMILLTIAGFAIWYFFFVLTQSQLFLVGWDYADISNHTFSSADASDIAKSFNGKWATLQDLQDAMSQGYSVQAAGYVSDVTTTDAGCNNQPQAFFSAVPDSAHTMPYVSNACSRGYFILGDKTKSSKKYIVYPWNDAKSVNNKYKISSWNDFVNAVKNFKIKSN